MSRLHHLNDWSKRWRSIRRSLLGLLGDFYTREEPFALPETPSWKLRECGSFWWIRGAPQEIMQAGRCATGRKIAPNSVVQVVLCASQCSVTVTKRLRQINLKEQRFIFDSGSLRIQPMVTWS